MLIGSHAQARKMVDRFPVLSESDLSEKKKLGNRMVKSVIAKYHNFVSVSQFNYLPKPKAEAKN